MIRRLGFWSVLAAIALIALALRLIGLDWDQGLYLHPDERFIVWVTTDLRWPESIGAYFQSSTSTLNPYNTEHGSFVYGTFPSFLVKSIAGLLDRDRFGDLYLVGRAVNAVFDTGTVVLTGLLSRRFFGDRAGVLAAVLLAFTPLFIQTAHFFTVDTIAVFFTVAAFTCVLRSWDRSSIGWMALAGVMIGLAGASKPNYLIALAFIALPVMELIRLRGWRSLLPRLREPVYPALPAALTGGFVAFWVFRFAQPYAFGGPKWWNISLNQQWLDDIAFWRAVQIGLVDMKPSIQWIDRTPVVYILQNMVLWGMGIALGSLVLAALILACWRILRSTRWPGWWLTGIVGWCLGSIAMYGTGIAQNQRYLMHIYPFLILLGAGFLTELEQRFPRKLFPHLLTIGVVVYTIVFGLAFDSLYVRPITRIEASEWIYENLPDGAVISNEYWDDALPLYLPGQERSRFPGLTLDLYADEANASNKISTLVGQLGQVDYIVLSSDRVIDSVVRQPERYPVAVRYYEMLLSGELGFEPLTEFRQGPEIFGIEWDDRGAEESLKVYEHPQVRIFRKSDLYNAQNVHDELTDAWNNGAFHSIPGDPLPRQMLMTDGEVENLNASGSWHNQVESGWLQHHPLISLWVTLQVIGIAAWPLTWRAFRTLPDAGWILAKGIGLAAMSVIIVVLTGWRSFPFDSGTVFVSLLLLAAIGISTQRCIWEGFRFEVRSRWKSILVSELVYLTAFLIAAFMRTQQSISPDHNLMQLAGLLRSVSLPPFDPWLSGGVLHTRWTALLPWAAIGKALSLEPVIVFNLAIVAVMATTAGVLWSLLATVARSWIGALIALIAVFGSSFAFQAGLAPQAMSDSFDLTVPTTVLVTVILLHTVKQPARQYWTRLTLIALLAGALIISIGGGAILALVLVGLSFAIDAWSRKTMFDPWWPIVRRFVLEVVGIISAGVVIWYPAYRTFTATARNLASPEFWPLSQFNDHVGVGFLLGIVIILGIGAMSVANQMLAEGPAGIATACLAFTMVLVLIVASWSFDSAIILLLSISLLAIVAGWHWLDDSTMLWSIGLILIATGIIIVSQTQQFHTDLAGNSSAWQLVPISWMLLAVAMGLAISHLTSAKHKHASITATILAVSLAVVMLIPTFNQIRIAGWDDRSELASPVITAPTEELAAIRWMQDYLSGVPVILTADGPNGGYVGTISAVTGFPTVLGGDQAERMMRPGWQGLVQRRVADVDAIYTGIWDWRTASPLIHTYDVRYIVVGSEERGRYGTAIDQYFADAEAEGHLQRVFEEDGIVIYHVITGPAAND